MEIKITININTQAEKSKTLLQDWNEKIDNWIKGDDIHSHPNKEN